VSRDTESRFLPASENEDDFLIADGKRRTTLVRLPSRIPGIFLDRAVWKNTADHQWFADETGVEPGERIGASGLA
jgi:hypothetical protein